MRAVAAALCLLTPLGLAACSRTLDADSLEEDIVSTYGLASASCPDEIEPKRGVTFACTATGPGGERVEIRIEQLNDDGNVKMFLNGTDEGD